MIALTHAPSPRMDACELTFAARTPINHQLATRQHADYCRMLSACGGGVITLSANLEMPDCVFIEDTAVVLDEVAVLASMGAASRRAEPAGIEPELRKHREIVRVELPATMEGGDVLRVGRTLLAGLSSRTNAAGITALSAIGKRHGYEIIPVPLRDCLHLKSACTALPDGSLLINPAWLDAGPLRKFKLVSVPAAEPWAADVLSVGHRVCMSAAFSQTAELVGGIGFEVLTVDVSEFAKAEGAVTCLSILFDAK